MAKRIKSLRFKVRLVLGILSFTLAFFSIVTAVKLGEITNRIEDIKEIYLPLMTRLASLESFFLSYQFDVNRLISKPTRDSVAQLNNSPLKKNIENSITELESKIIRLSTEKNSEEMKKYQKWAENIRRAFTNYNRAITGILQAIEPNSDAANKEFSNMQSFSEMIHSAHIGFLLSERLFNREIEKRINLYSIYTYQDSNKLTFVAMGLAILAIILAVVAIMYTDGLIERIKRISAAISQIRQGNFKPEEVELNLPIVKENEFNNLTSEIKGMASELYMTDNELRDRIARFEEQNMTLKLITTYTGAILNSLDLGILVTDNHLKVSFVNTAFENFWKVKKNNVVDVEIDDLPFIRLIDGWKNAVGRIIKNDTKQTEILKSEYKLAESPLFHVLISVMPLHDSNNKELLGTISITKDITSDVKLNEKLLLSERLTMIGMMSAQVAHEIRNPLNSISLNAEILRDKSGDEKLGDVARKIIREVERLSSIIEEYLTYARMPEIKRRTVHLNEFIDELVDSYSKELSGSGISIEKKIDENIFASIDYDQMKQVMLNLLRNAREAIPSNDGHIKVIARKRAEDGFVELTVNDNGIGIPKDIQTKIFQPFYSTKGGGTGLGLYITQQIVNRHGGDIVCYSGENRGTSMKITIPMEAGANA